MRDTAIEALEAVPRTGNNNVDFYVGKALAALRSEVHEEKEVVAWMSEESGSIVKTEELKKMNKYWKGVYCIPLYRLPQPPKP